MSVGDSTTVGGTLTGGDSPRRDHVRALAGLRHPPIGADRQIAVVLIKKRVKALVLRRRQIEHGKELAVTAGRLPQSRVDQVDEILTGQFTRLEWLVDDRPEVFAGRKPVKQTCKCGRLLVDR